MEGAKVASIDALRSFRAALIKFAETTGSALTDADADVRSTLIWLERDQRTYWTGQIRKRHDALERAKEALRHKQLYKGPAGGRQSDVDEVKMVAKCKAALEEAERKLENVKKSIARLNKQMMEFTGQTTRLSTTVQAEVPAAVGELDRMVTLLDQYVSMSTPATVRSTSDEAGAGAMGRPAEGKAEEKEIDWRALRSATPAPSIRAGAERGLLSFGPWKSAEVRVIELDALKLIELPRLEPAAEEIVVLARDVNEREAIYLERLEPAFGADSGWYFGSAEPVADRGRLIALTVGDVLAMRPDLASILALPRGVLVGVEERGIAAILSGDDTDVWTAVRPAPEAADGAGSQDAAAPTE